jgi:hypothetical protein
MDMIPRWLIVLALLVAIMALAITLAEHTTIP